MLKQTLKLMGSLYNLSNIKHIKLKHLDTRNECLSVKWEENTETLLLQIKFLRSEGLRAPAAERIRPVTVKITQRLQKGFYF